MAVSGWYASSQDQTDSLSFSRDHVNAKARSQQNMLTWITATSCFHVSWSSRCGQYDSCDLFGARPRRIDKLVCVFTTQHEFATLWS